jgi:hypothetical protein
MKGFYYAVNLKYYLLYSMVNVKDFYSEVNLNSEGFLPYSKINYYYLYFMMNVKGFYSVVNLNEEIYTYSEFEMVPTLS